MKINIFLKKIYHELKFLLNLSAFNEYQFSPIDLSKPLPKESISKLNKLIEEFSNYSQIIIRPSDGTLLGLLRDKSLIPHDNDIDFDVEWSIDAERIIKLIAKKNNWKIIRKVSYYRRTQQLTYYDNKNIVYDFIFWSTDGRFAINFSEPSHFRIMKSKFLLDLINLEINNFTYQVPKNYEEWLIYRYGKTWNVSQVSKGDWKDDCGDLGNAWWL